MLFVAEAGGKVSDLDDPERDPVKTGAICAANLDLHPQIVERLKAASA